MRIRLAAIVVLCSLSAAVAEAKKAYTWTGAGGDGLWSTPANWSPAGPPEAGSDLAFGAAGSGTKTNDLAPGTSFGHILFSACGHRIDGNDLTVTGGMSNPQSCVAAFGAKVRLGGTQTLTGFPFWFHGGAELGGGTVTHSAHLQFHGPLDGSGTLHSDFHSIVLAGGGDFDGTIEAELVYLGSALPEADVIANRTHGRGRVGTLSTISLLPAPEVLLLTGIGRIDTEGLTLRAPVNGGFYNFIGIDIQAAGHDQVVVAGSVTIANAILQLGSVTSSLTVGQSFTIIDNDGTDAVAGTFAGRAEGSLLTADGTTFRLSYAGGDGNDVTVTVDRIAKSWTGGAGDGLWSSAANWSPAGAPADGDAVRFPVAPGGPIAMVNDLAPLTLSEFHVQRPLTLSGNALTVHRFSSLQAPLTGVVIDNDVTLPTPHEIPAVTFRGRVQISGATLFDAINTRFEGPLDGNAVIRPYYGAYLGGGNFSGTLIGGTAIEVGGHLPNADIAIHDTVSGSGVFGKLAAFVVSPGTPGAPIGRMQFATRGSFAGYQVDLTPTDSDQISIVGPLSIDSWGALTVNVRSGSPAVGQVYRILENDGADAITGTFSNLPEGSVMDVSGFRMRLSYKGGDGNDIALTVLAPARRWTGAAGNGRLSDPANWTPAGTPAGGESLFFPDDTPKNVINDLPAGTRFASLSFAPLYTLRGNALTITEGMKWYANSPIDLPLRFEGNVTLDGQFIFGRPVEIAGNASFPSNSQHDFRGGLNGAGTIAAHFVRVFDAGGNFTGTITSWYFSINASLPNANVVAGSSISGSGTLGNVTTGDLSAGHFPSFEPLRVADLDLSPAAQQPSWKPATLVRIDGTQASRVYVKKVTLAGNLHLVIEGPAPAPGSVFTIFDNDGNDPIHGAFANRPDGSQWTEGSANFRISYSGGDGNDITLTVVPNSTTTLAQSSDSSRLGERVTLTATVTASPSAPAGEVDFYIDGKLTGSAPVINGTATLRTRVGDLGTHEIQATFRSSGGTANSTSAKRNHTVVRALPQWTISSSYASGSALLTLVAGRADGVEQTPSGNVRVLNPGNLAYGQLADGMLMLPLGQFAGGTHPLTIDYAGDASYDAQLVPYALVIPAPALDVRGAEVTAGDTATIVVRLSSAAIGPIHATWRTIDGSARAGRHYTAGSGAVTFAPGETEKRIEVVTLRNGAGDVTTFAVTVESSDAMTRTTTGTVSIVPATAVQTHLGLAYSAHGTLDLYIPSDGQPRLPLIVALDARDWSMPQSAQPIALRAAGRGYAVAVVRFRTSIQAKFPAQLDDAAAALHYLRSHASQYKLDADRIGIWGIGAGGHIAALLGTLGEKVQAVAVWNAPTDLGASAASCGRLGAEVAMLLDGDAFRDADPATFASEKDAPFLIMHGGGDCAVPTEHAIRLDTALRAANVASSLHVLPNIGGYDDPAWRDPGVLAVVDAFFDQWLRQTHRRRGVR